MEFIAAIKAGTIIQGALIYLFSEKAGGWAKGKVAKTVANKRLKRKQEAARDERVAWLEEKLAAQEDPTG